MDLGLEKGCRECKGREWNGIVSSAVSPADSRTKVRDSSDEKNNFFRISFGTRQGTLLVISDFEATIIDIEVSIAKAKLIPGS